MLKNVFDVSVLKSIYYTVEGNNVMEKVSLSDTCEIPYVKKDALSAIERCLAGDTSSYYDEQDGVTSLNRITSATLELGSSGTIVLDKGICKRVSVPNNIVCIRYTGLPSKFIRSFRCNPTQECNMGEFDGTDFAIDFTHFSYKVPNKVWSRIEVLFNELGLGNISINDKEGIKFNFTGDIKLAKAAYLLLAEMIFWKNEGYDIVMLLNFKSCDLGFVERFYEIASNLSNDVYIVS